MLSYDVSDVSGHVFQSAVSFTGAFSSVLDAHTMRIQCAYNAQPPPFFFLSFLFFHFISFLSLSCWNRFRTFNSSEGKLQTFLCSLICCNSLGKTSTWWSGVTNLWPESMHDSSSCVEVDVLERKKLLKGQDRGTPGPGLCVRPNCWTADIKVNLEWSKKKKKDQQLCTSLYHKMLKCSQCSPIKKPAAAYITGMSHTDIYVTIWKNLLVSRIELSKWINDYFTTDVSLNRDRWRSVETTTRFMLKCWVTFTSTDLDDAHNHNSFPINNL